MRHKKSTKKFKRTTEERRRLKLDLCRSLIRTGQITTFEARAKWFAPFFERLVTLVKRAKGDEKLAYYKVRPYLDEATARELIEKVVPKLNDRSSGFTRILKYQDRFGLHKKAIVSIVTE
jgi:large subunit ribosomal protein L17